MKRSPNTSKHYVVRSVDVREKRENENERGRERKGRTLELNAETIMRSGPS